MLERDLAKLFSAIFQRYHVWVPNDRFAGWPDRGVQINNSRMVWFELKIVRSNEISVSIDLSREQAAWLAKWQMNGGLCYLFLGLVNGRQELEQYAILSFDKWRYWLTVPHERIGIKQLLLFTEQSAILRWFEEIITSNENVNERSFTS